MNKVIANSQNLRNASIVHVSDIKYVCIDQRTGHIYDTLVYKNGNYCYLLNAEFVEVSNEPEDSAYIKSIKEEK